MRYIISEALKLRGMRSFKLVLSACKVTPSLPVDWSESCSPWQRTGDAGREPLSLRRFDALQKNKPTRWSNKRYMLVPEPFLSTTLNPVGKWIIKHQSDCVRSVFLNYWFFYYLNTNHNRIITETEINCQEVIGVAQNQFVFFSNRVQIWVLQFG